MLIKDALVFLLAAGLVVPILRALKLPAVVGFILAGLALGPSGFSAFSDQVPILEYVTISDPAAAAPFAELGVLFLLFLLGLELSFQKLWALKRTVFGAGMNPGFKLEGSLLQGSGEFTDMMYLEKETGYQLADDIRSFIGKADRPS